MIEKIKNLILEIESILCLEKYPEKETLETILLLLEKIEYWKIRLKKV